MADIPDWILRRVREMAKEVVEVHRHCDIANTRRCDLYHDLVQKSVDVLEDMKLALGEKMRCGHPLACLEDNCCCACQKERDIIKQVKFSALTE